MISYFMHMYMSRITNQILLLKKLPGFFFNHLTFFRITYFKYIVKHQVMFLAENVHFMLHLLNI